MQEHHPVTTSVTVFYAYAPVPKDEPLRQELEKHLSLLRRQGLIAQWHERQVAAGTDWQQELDYHLMSASIILLLISPDFLASDYCYSRELERAMQRHAARQARVIPVLVRPVDIQGAPFAHLQPLPSNGKPVTKWPNRDDAFAAIASGLRTVVEQLRQTVVATLEVSLTFLAEQERARYQELAVFPEEVTIPLATLQRLWGATAGLDDFQTERLCQRLHTLSLLLAFDPTTQQVRVHDVVRSYLQIRFLNHVLYHISSLTI